MTEEERKNIPIENLVNERYLANFDYLALLSASHSNKNFKAKQIQDDLMFSSVKLEVKVLKKTESIIKDLQSMEVMWTDKQRKQLNETKIRELEKEAA